ncbi:MAG: sensor histidine kinase [Bacteroidota bacterium]|nr:sensor histidine kinase [Bacteroidota bacterium]MDP4259054.1 sensor histidine kinase [Bacteroidota bacterium]
MENKVLNITILLSIVISIIIIYFFVSIIRYHRRYMRLQRERIFAEITIRENERKRIAGDLHDSLGPLLSAVKLNISSVEIPDAGDREVLEKTSRYLDEIIGSLRRISYDLLPNTLERKGLVEAIREFVSQMNLKKNIDIQLFVVKEIRVPNEKEIHIFRMIQEIVHNTIKHAGAKTLQIGMSEEGGNLLFLTKDDGRGFDKERELSRTNGLGLKSLASRCEILNGVLSLESKPGAGTNYFIKIPVS